SGSTVRRNLVSARDRVPRCNGQAESWEEAEQRREGPRPVLREKRGIGSLGRRVRILHLDVEDSAIPTSHRRCTHQLWQTIPEGFHRMGTQEDGSGEEHSIPPAVSSPPGQRTRIRLHLCHSWRKYPGNPEQGAAERKEPHRIQ